jgi:hypothetical protein
VDKTIRLFADEPNGKRLITIDDIDEVIKSNTKLNMPITRDDFTVLTYYDTLDIEFEYIGDYRTLSESFFALIELIYEPYDKYSVSYNVIRSILNNIDLFNLYPKLTLMTNSAATSLNISNYYFTHKLIGEKAMVVVLGLLNDSTNTIYLITQKYIKNISASYTSGSTEISLINTLNEFTDIGSNYDIPLISVFEGVMTSATSLTVTDVLYYNSRDITKDDIDKRIAILTEFKTVPHPVLSKLTICEYFKIQSWESAYEMIKTFLETSDLYSGLIGLRLKRSLLNSGDEYAVIKLKYKLLNTANFYVFNNKLYVKNTGNNIMRVTEELPNGLIPYESPFRERSYEFNIIPSPLHQPIVFDASFPTKLRNKFEKMKLKDMNNTIVESIMVDNRWIPLRFESNVSTYEDVIMTESAFHEANTAVTDHDFSLDATRKMEQFPKKLYTEVYTMVDQYIREKVISGMKYKNVIHFFDDTAIETNQYQIFESMKNVFIVHNSMSQIGTHISKLIKNRNNPIEFSFVQDTKLNKQIEDVDFVYIQQTSGGFSELYKSLNGRYCFDTVDVVFLDNQFTGINSLLDLINFKMFCKQVLSPNGKLIIKYFNEQRIHTMFSEDNNEGNDNGGINNSTATAKSGRKRVLDKTLKTLDMKIVEKTFPNKLVELDAVESINLNPETIFNINTGEYNAWTDVEPKFYEQTTDRFNSRTTADGFTVTYKTDKFVGMKIGDSMKNNALLVYYYGKLGCYERNGVFKSKKILTKNQTIGFNNILGVDFELDTNPYDRTLSSWCSESHFIDHMFGSSGYSQTVVDNNIEQAVLLEVETVHDDWKRFLLNRVESKYHTVVVTRNKVKYLQKFALNFSDNYFCYVIHPKRLCKQDTIYLNTTIGMNLQDELKFIEYYTHPRCSGGVNDYIVKPMFHNSIWDVFSDYFNCYETIAPFTTDVVAKKIASSEKFEKIELLENFLDAMDVKCFEKRFIL